MDIDSTLSTVEAHRIRIGGLRKLVQRELCPRMIDVIEIWVAAKYEQEYACEDNRDFHDGWGWTKAPEVKAKG